MGLNVSPPIWQSYINTILNCLESRKYCEAIMDDAYEKIGRFTESLAKEWIKISPQEMPTV